MLIFIKPNHADTFRFYIYAFEHCKPHTKRSHRYKSVIERLNYVK